MQQPLNYPIYYQPTLSPSHSATSTPITPITPSYPYQISYAQPQSFIRTNSYQFGMQNTIPTYPVNILNNSFSSISSSVSSASSGEKNHSLDSINKNILMTSSHPNPMQMPMNMPIKYVYPQSYQQPQPYVPQPMLYNANTTGYYPQQPLSPPLSIRYGSQSSALYNDQQIPHTPVGNASSNNVEKNTDTDTSSIISIGNSTTASPNQANTANDTGNTTTNDILPQSNDISVLTPIPGCMAYHHPLIPVIPSASGNTRKQASRLFDNKIHSLIDGENSVNTQSQQDNSTGEVRRMAFGSPTWTSKDDELLRHLKETEKIGWRDISMYFPTRTINACQFRWRRLIMKEENKKKREAHKLAIKEKLMKSNKI